MKYRPLGKTGLSVSEIGFGGWAIGGQWGGQDERDSIAALNRAIDLGLNFIDTAAGYGNGQSAGHGAHARFYVSGTGYSERFPGFWQCKRRIRRIHIRI